MNSAINKKTALVIALVLIFAIATLAIYYYFYHVRQQSSAPQGLYVGLLTHNAAFAKAESLRNAGHVQSAIPYYKEALNETTNINERGQIIYLIAASETRSSSVSDAIQRLKDIAANPGYSDSQRAYAIQEIGELFYQNTDRNLTTIIFSGEPYADFYKEKDIALAMRRLYQYADAFYTLALSELRSAHWYGIDLVHLSKQEKLTNADKQERDADVAIIEDSLAKADADIQRTVSDPKASTLIPAEMTYKAEVLGDLKVAGIQEPGLEDPDAAFQSAIKIGNANGNELTPRYNYAVYLAEEFGMARAADIHINLSVIYSNLSKNYGFRTYFSAEKNNVTGAKTTMVHLAAIDPGFKQALLSLGWTNADFQ
ncbi:MAG: hypothetical protein WAN50_04520 [Minisyncoccia bacterium]